MDSTPIIVTLAQLLIDSPKRGIQELEQSNLNDCLIEAIKEAFTQEPCDFAIAKLLSSSNNEIKAAGGIILWVQKSREARTVKCSLL